MGRGLPKGVETRSLPAGTSVAEFVQTAFGTTPLSFLPSLLVRPEIGFRGYGIEIASPLTTKTAAGEIDIVIPDITSTDLAFQLPAGSVVSQARGYALQLFGDILDILPFSFTHSDMSGNEDVDRNRLGLSRETQWHLDEVVARYLSLPPQVLTDETGAIIYLSSDDSGGGSTARRRDDDIPDYYSVRSLGCGERDTDSRLPIYLPDDADVYFDGRRLLSASDPIMLLSIIVTWTDALVREGKISDPSQLSTNLAMRADTGRLELYGGTLRGDKHRVSAATVIIGIANAIQNERLFTHDNITEAVDLVRIAIIELMKWRVEFDTAFKPSDISLQRSVETNFEVELPESAYIFFDRRGTIMSQTDIEILIEIIALWILELRKSGIEIDHNTFSSRSYADIHTLKLMGEGVPGSPKRVSVRNVIKGAMSAASKRRLSLPELLESRLRELNPDYDLAGRADLRDRISFVLPGRINMPVTRMDEQSGRIIIPLDAKAPEGYASHNQLNTYQLALAIDAWIRFLNENGDINIIAAEDIGDQVTTGTIQSRQKALTLLFRDGSTVEVAIVSLIRGLARKAEIIEDGAGFDVPPDRLRSGQLFRKLAAALPWVMRVHAEYDIQEGIRESIEPETAPEIMDLPILIEGGEISVPPSHLHSDGATVFVDVTGLNRFLPEGSRIDFKSYHKKSPIDPVAATLIIDGWIRALKGADAISFSSPDDMIHAVLRDALWKRYGIALRDEEQSGAISVGPLKLIKDAARGIGDKPDTRAKEKSHPPAVLAIAEALMRVHLAENNRLGIEERGTDYDLHRLLNRLGRIETEPSKFAVRRVRSLKLIAGLGELGSVTRGRRIKDPTRWQTAYIAAHWILHYYSKGKISALSDITLPWIMDESRSSLITYGPRGYGASFTPADLLRDHRRASGDLTRPLSEDDAGNLLSDVTVVLREMDQRGLLEAEERALIPGD